MLCTTAINTCLDVPCRCNAAFTVLAFGCVKQFGCPRVYVSYTVKSVIRHEQRRRGVHIPVLDR